MGPDLLGFVCCAGSYAALVGFKLAPDDLAWPTIFNADIFVYMKASAYLAFFPGAFPTVGGADLHSIATHDVFGTFGLLTFAKFTLGTGLGRVAVPVMGLGIGLIGMAVSRCCRTVFRLSLPLSVLVALVTVTGPLFQYVVLNYFLSQTVFVAVMLTVSLWLVEVRSGTGRAGLAAAVVVAVASGCVLLCYDVWLLQFVAMMSALMAALRILAPTGRLRVRAGAALVAGGAAAALSLGVSALTSPSRLGDVLSKLAAMSVPNSSGWSLPFVDPGLLLGLPIDWQPEEAPKVSIAGPIMGAVLLLAMLGIAAARLDRGDGSLRRKTAFGLFCAAALAYLVVWTKFGEAYQQWKFASTLPLGFGFTVLATMAHLLRLDALRSRAAVLEIAAATFLVVCIGLDGSLARDKLMSSLAHIPASMADLATVDRLPGNEPVYVDVTDFQARMTALAFINLKPLTFQGHSQFGPGTSPPTGEPYVAIRAVCDPAGEKRTIYKAETVQPGKWPVVSVGTTIRFSTDITACLSSTGFAPPEPWGQRTSERQAAIRFDCACDLGATDVDVVLRAAAPMLPDLPGSQTMRVMVDGAVPRSFALDATGFRDLVIPIPRQSTGVTTVDLAFDLPDAVPRPDGDPASGMLYSLSVESLELRRRTGDP